MTKPERQHFRPVVGPRTHGNCKSQTGVMRPGKTARDKFTKGGGDTNG